MAAITPVVTIDRQSLLSKLTEKFRHQKHSALSANSLNKAHVDRLIAAAK